MTATDLAQDHSPYDAICDERSTVLMWRCRECRQIDLVTETSATHPQRQAPEDDQFPHAADCEYVARKTARLADIELIETLHRAPRIGEAEGAKVRDVDYWQETGRLVGEYFVLRAGSHDPESVRRFLLWLRNTPGGVTAYEDGDDTTRAALVDWFVEKRLRRAGNT